MIDLRKMNRPPLHRTGIGRAALAALALACIVVAMPSKASAQDRTARAKPGGSPRVKGLSTKEKIASGILAQQAAEQISSVEWLAPLAPVALSPFFGVTLLSGLACFGPDWLPDNALLSDGSPLANPNLFWGFLTLTVITSLPRLSKVSKPLAQLADFLETYSVIVIMVVMKASTSIGVFDDATPAEMTPAAAGFLSMSWDALLMVAMAVNIVVVNTVKFMFEFLIWLTPIPFLDACFEAANKSTCAALMAVYAYSPVIALVINVVFFVACALFFRWGKRREVFARSVLWDWLARLWRSNQAAPEQFDGLVVFPRKAIGDIPAMSRCRLERQEDALRLTCPRLFRAPLIHVFEQAAGKLKSGWWVNTLQLHAESEPDKLLFSSRHNQHLASLAEYFEVALENDDSKELSQAAPTMG